MNTILKKLYPRTKIALSYSSTWELLVAVMLSAQCTDTRVNVVTQKLFRQFPTIESYHSARQKEMERAVYQCGFYRTKAKNIRGAAKMVLEKFDGRVPHTMEELLMLPGVARKTANVVLSNAFHIHDGIAVDTHVRRFTLRFDLSDYTDPVRIEKDLMQILPKKEWGDFSHRLIAYGRDICPARKHACSDHPLTRIHPKAQDIWPRAQG